MTKLNSDVKNMTFEAALGELEEIVRKLESGQAPLEESITTYERGVSLKQYCESKLQDARMKIEQISLNPDGQAQTAEFQEK